MNKKFLYILLLTMSTYAMNKRQRIEAAAPIDPEIVAQEAGAESSSRYNDAATRALYEAVIKNPGEGDDTMKNVEKDVAVVREALAKGGNPNAQINPKKYTLLQEALIARWPKLNVIKELLAAGADPNLRDYKGRNSVDLAKEAYGKFLSDRAGHAAMKTNLFYGSPEANRRYFLHSAVVAIIKELENAIQRESAKKVQAESRKRKAEIARQTSTHILPPLAQLVADYLGDYADMMESEAETKKLASCPA